MGEVHHQVLVLPGLGDEHARGQDKLIKTWRLFGLRTHYHQIGWGDGEHFGPKLDEIMEEATRLKAKGPVSIAGFSAGGDAAVIAFAQNPELFNKILTFCTPFHPEKVEPSRYEQSPAFEDAMGMLPESLATLGKNALRRIQAWYPLADEVVSPADAVLEGENKTHEKRIYMAGHVFSIGAAQLLGGFSAARFIKS